MESHHYQFKPRDLILLLLTPLLPLLLLFGVYQAARAGKLLPKPRPTFDTDQTILVHQAEASDRSSGAAVLLVGDSSCLMNVDALPLGQELGQPTVNLGTLSLLGLANFGELVEHYLRANPGTVRTVVLIQHPEALRRGKPEARYVGFLRHFYAGTDDCNSPGIFGSLLCQARFEGFRSRVVSRLVPSPLSGSYGIAYGFSDDLERFMDAHHGTVFEPVRSKFSGNPEYWLADHLRQPSAEFRRLVPTSVKLAIAVTPVPRSFALPDHAQRYAEILTQWGQWIGADAVLTNLPSTMADTNFASVTHLNPTGLQIYTSLMAAELKRVF